MDNRPTVFLFNDTQIVDESFLEDINNILSSGEVPNLFKPDELSEVRVSSCFLSTQSHCLHDVQVEPLYHDTVKSRVP